MARSRAERDRDREDLLLAIDELGPRASTPALALAMDSTYTRVLVDLRAMVKAGQIADVQIDHPDAPSHGWVWVRGDSLDADRQSDVDDIRRQEWTWKPAL